MQMYTATVEVATKAAKVAKDDKATDSAMTALELYHPALSGSPRGWWAATITLPAETLVQAATTACLVIAAALGADPIAVNVTTEAEADAREGWAPLPELVSISEAARILGVTRQAVHERITRGTLPGEKIGRSYAIPRTALQVPGR